jgi:outer membrane protein OmpA-like peptidoglycan-associated protein
MKYLYFVFLAIGVKSLAQDYTILEHNQQINIMALPMLNTSSRECNLSILPNGKSLFFMSTRAFRGGASGNGDLYQSNFINGQWEAPTPLSSINTVSGEDEPTFSADGSTMYYQSWAGDWATMGGPYYQANLINGIWEKKGSMGMNINRFFALQSKANMGYGTDGMAVSADGKLFVVACGPDYRGPMDLYYSIKGNQGWTFPKIMGVSTTGDERSVFIAADNRTIYFSSDGMGGFGGLDIFRVRISDDGTLGDPINIGAPFNTPSDDMGFVASADGRSAFFIRDLDIYYADITALDEAIKPMKSSKTVEISSTNDPVKIADTIPTQKDSEPITVYFEHDVAELQVFEQNKLNSIMDTKAQIHLHGYCDADGSNTYNLALAKRRCETVRKVLMSQGIPDALLMLHIHGEADPIASNNTTKGKAANRRVVVQID